MARSLMSSIAQLQREAERQRLAASRKAEAAQRAYERAQVADEREEKRLHAESRQADIELANHDLEQQVAALEHLLTDGLKVDAFVDLPRLKAPPALPVWDPGTLYYAEAQPTRPTPPAPPSGLNRLSRLAKEDYQRAIDAQEAWWQQAVIAHAEREEARQASLQAAWNDHLARTARIEADAARQHEEIDALQTKIGGGDPDGIRAYFGLVLESRPYPEMVTHDSRLAYVPESKQLVVETDLPPFTVVPQVAAYRYVKTGDKVTSAARPVGQRKSLYASLIAQVALLTVRDVLLADRWGYVDTVVFNGHVDTVNPGTGHAEHPCLITLRVSKDALSSIDLSRVDPVTCLKALNASVSANPADLAPVRPVLEFSMVDPRFIDQTDVLAALDDRPNLMELTPGEFEQLITNLFERMGLETRLTQASRDGGVDCVAYDPRPIFGGKVVIQAKRYKHTVGVSAVRDLFGTMQNEGASKGILVTTSGYGRASYEFADGKPLELLSGSNLLYLLAEHAGIEAKIQPPEDWQDPTPDSSEF
jgi:restriction system protein